MASDAATTRLFLIRHGRVEDAWRDRMYGDMDVPLSAAGREDAERAAALLRDEPLAAVVSSGLARTEYGAALLRRGRDLPRVDRPELREIHRGAWRGLTRAEIEAAEPGALRRWHEAPEERRPPGGESLTDLSRRVVPVLAELAATHAGEEVAVVAHSWVIRVALCDALDLPLRLAERLVVGCGQLVALDLAASSDADLRPTLSGFGWQRIGPRRAWHRGSHRG